MYSSSISTVLAVPSVKTTLAVMVLQGHVSGVHIQIVGVVALQGVEADDIAVGVQDTGGRRYPEWDAPR